MSKENNEDLSLFDICSDSKFTELESLIKKGCNLLATDKKGYTALDCVLSIFFARNYYKVSDDSYKTVKLLIENGVGISKSGVNQLCYFLQYILENKGEIVTRDLLVNLRSHLNISSEDRTLLSMAYRLRQLELAKLLIEYGANIDFSNDEGNSILHNNCQVDQLDNVKSLIEYKANVNLKNNVGETPLIFLLTNRNFVPEVNIVELLLNNGADITAKDNNGKTALYHALSGRSSEITSLLLDKGSSFEELDLKDILSFLFACTQQQDKNLVKLIVDNAKIKVKEKNYDIKVVKQLLCSPSGLCEEKYREYKDLLLDFGSLEIKAWLLEHNEKIVSELPLAELLPLMIKNSWVNAIKYAINKDESIIFCKDKNGITPLELACSVNTTNMEEIIKLLVDKGADMSALSKETSLTLVKILYNRIKKKESGLKYFKWLIDNKLSVSFDVGGYKEKVQKAKTVEEFFNNLVSEDKTSEALNIDFIKLLFGEQGAVTAIDNQHTQKLINFIFKKECPVLKFLIGNNDVLKKSINEVYKLPLCNKNANKTTVLYQACHGNDYNLVKFLIENRADINVKTQIKPYPIEVQINENSTPYFFQGVFNNIFDSVKENFLTFCCIVKKFNKDNKKTFPKPVIKLIFKEAFKVESKKFHVNLTKQESKNTILEIAERTIKNHEHSDWTTSSWIKSSLDRNEFIDCIGNLMQVDNETPKEDTIN